jgi:hypothetical protein
MRLKIEVLLAPVTQKIPLKIRHSDDQCLVLADDRPVSVVISTKYNMESSIDLFSIENLTEGIYQRVSVTGILINDVPLKNWRRFCSFSIKGNRYINDADCYECYELSFNGRFFLNVRGGWDQFCWFPYYYSARRSDFVYSNTVLDCNATHHCYSERCSDMHLSSHRNRFLNSPYNPRHKPGDAFRYGCFGCSFTEGAALARGEEWPAVLAENSTVINLGVGGGGADTIFLNLSRALDTFQIQRVVILFPNLQRRLLRFGVEGQHFRVPVCIGGAPDSDAKDSCIWCSQAWLNNRRSQIKQRLYMDDRTTEYSRRVIGRTVKLLQLSGVPYWVSSWSTDTYTVLSSAVSPDRLLPFFTRDRNALDGRHSSGQSHRAWLKQILPIVNS